MNRLNVLVVLVIGRGALDDRGVRCGTPRMCGAYSSAITPLWTALGAVQGRDEPRFKQHNIAGRGNSIRPGDKHLSGLSCAPIEPLFFAPKLRLP